MGFMETWQKNHFNASSGINLNPLVFFKIKKKPQLSTGLAEGDVGAGFLDVLAVAC